MQKARLLHIATGPVLSRILKIADSIKKPAILIGRPYEVDELKAFIKRKDKECWVIYALDRESKTVVDLKVGNRNKKNIKRVTDTLILSDCKKIYTDALNIYRYVVSSTIHHVVRYGTNKIERSNLSLRTHLKRLNRKTIAFSKNISMLEACLKIYFWYYPNALHAN